MIASHFNFMFEQSNIAWTDSTLNFWEGCTKVSAGCLHCYAEARDRRFTGGKLWGKGAERRKSKSAVKDALAFNRKPWICEKYGQECHCDGVLHGRRRRRIFSLSLGDWLDDEVPIEWLAEMLETLRVCQDVTWILCTKRPENFKERLTRVMIHFENTPETKQRTATWKWVLDWVVGEKVPSNIIQLTSVENQAAADKRIPELLKIPAACRGLSLEPLLGAVDLSGWIPCFNRDGVWQFDTDNQFEHNPPLDWLIIGGESGHNARPCKVDWIRSLVAQGKAAGVATFVKQVGSNPERGAADEPFERIKNVRKHGYDHHEAVPYDKKGGDPAEWSADLRVQQWPKGF